LHPLGIKHQVVQTHGGNGDTAPCILNPDNRELHAPDDVPRYPPYRTLGGAHSWAGSCKGNRNLLLLPSVKTPFISLHHPTYALSDTPFMTCSKCNTFRHHGAILITTVYKPTLQSLFCCSCRNN